MRISNGMIWSSVLGHTNSALSNYYRLAEQNASTKKVNSPSDDASGTGAILDLRDHLSQLEQYQKNIDTARGYLNSADDALTTMSESIIRAKELCEQAATGTLSDEQRLIVAEQVRELMKEMLAVANTEFMDDSIFAGEETDSNAYQMALGVDVSSGTLAEDEILNIEGSADRSIQVEFLDGGNVGTTATGDLDYRYSNDGGETWTTATLVSGDTTLDLGTCVVELADGATVSDDTAPEEASAFIVRPTAEYLGDDSDGADVMQYGSSSLLSQADGSFGSNVTVRIDTGGDIITDTIGYSYSTDGGATWVEGNTAEDGLMTVPGGVLRLSPDLGTTVGAGEQFVITPHDGDIELAISDSSFITTNNIGKDIFGGIYQAPGETNASAVGGPNLFETMGELVGALETNDVDAIGECLEKLNACQEQVTSAAADVGAREQRLDAAETSLGIRELNEGNQLSAIEDADLITLSVQMEAAEVIYQSVVETSSTIMRLSLVNYL